MKPLTKAMISSIPLLLFATVFGSTAQRTTRAAVQPTKDRQAAPSFRLANASGKLAQLADFRGKPVLLNLWATECGGCRAELPTFIQLDKTYKDKGLVVIGVSMDIMYENLKGAEEGWARVKPFVKARGMEYQILMDDGAVEKGFKVNALPATYLIDRRGRIAATYIGVVDPANLEGNIKKIMSERR